MRDLAKRWRDRFNNFVSWSFNKFKVDRNQPSAVPNGPSAFMVETRKGLSTYMVLDPASAQIFIDMFHGWKEMKMFGVDDFGGGYKAVMNRLSRVLKISLQPFEHAEEETRTFLLRRTNRGRRHGKILSSTLCLHNHHLVEKYVCFDFEDKGWRMVPEGDPEKDSPRTGSGRIIIPFRDAHTSLTLKGPAPLVSLLNLQSQVDHTENLHILSVNARFALFNETSYPLRATAFVLCPLDGEKSFELPPLTLPAVQAATVLTKPNTKEVKGETAADEDEAPYPLELWHLVGTGDAETIPCLALSSPGFGIYGHPLLLDLSQNNSRITVPMKTEVEQTNVPLIVHLEDRENGQQMLITVKETKSDILVHNKCDRALVLKQTWVNSTIEGTDWNILSDPERLKWIVKIPSTTRAHFILRSETHSDVELAQTKLYIALQAKDKGDQWSNCIQPDECLNGVTVYVPSYGYIKVSYCVDDETTHLALKLTNSTVDLVDAKPIALSASETLPKEKAEIL